MADDLLQQLRSQAINRIAVCRRRQLHALNQMKECVFIAAHQVTEIRLQRLEQPPTPGLGSLLFEAAVAECFGFAGRTVVTFLKGVFNDILRTRMAFALLPKSDLGLALRNDLRTLRAQEVGKYEQILENLSKQKLTPVEKATRYDEIKSVLKEARAGFNVFQAGFLDEPEIRSLYHESTFKMVDSVIEKAANPDELKRLVRAATSGQDNSARSSGELPIASMVRSAVSYYNRQIEAQERATDELTTAATYLYDKSELLKLLMVLGVEDQDDTRSALRTQDWCIRWTEFCIWTRLYPDVGKSGAKLVNLPEELLQYLLKRMYVIHGDEGSSERLRTIAEVAKKRVTPQNQFILATGHALKPEDDEGWGQGELESANIILAQQWRACVMSIDNASRRLNA